MRPPSDLDVLIDGRSVWEARAPTIKRQRHALRCSGARHPLALFKMASLRTHCQTEKCWGSHEAWMLSAKLADCSCPKIMVAAQLSDAWVNPAAHGKQLCSGTILPTGDKEDSFLQSAEQLLAQQLDTLQGIAELRNRVIDSVSTLSVEPRREIDSRVSCLDKLVDPWSLRRCWTFHARHGKSKARSLTTTPRPGDYFGSLSAARAEKSASTGGLAAWISGVEEGNGSSPAPSVSKDVWSSLCSNLNINGTDRDASIPSAALSKSDFRNFSSSSFFFLSPAAMSTSNWTWLF
ncbi:hypothetical protein HPB51_020348 [Rhipicephalus microplus]|uniref:Uncharacterized protein n=1 Tax=Rhipicephalus microplus TaxID=6941 RepID=A0A9J6DWA5_RHIMP|nr:hypothetical protein HPB51_020348 [Rhipicephalus microplus]